MKPLTLTLLLTLSLSANPFKTLMQKVKKKPNRAAITMELMSVGVEILRYKTSSPARPTVTIFPPGKPIVGAPK